MGKPKILVVDDERDMRIFVSTVVETLGFEAIAVQDGAEALLKAGLNPPALVIQTYRQFRTDPSLSHIPIIMLSAIAEKTFLHSIKMLSPQQDYQLPEPEAYMEKPPDANELSRLISALLPTDKQNF
jgi:CheY-like chemotaxis protein